MQNEIIEMEESDNMFSYLGDEIITVISALEWIYFDNDECDLSRSNKATILALDKIHYYDDDLFDTATNEVLTKYDILKKYNIKTLHYDLNDKFKEPKKLANLNIMEVFKYDLEIA